ncbi:MAG: tail fiber domain-containing protein [Bacteroidia bacterium]
MKTTKLLAVTAAIAVLSLLSYSKLNAQWFTTGNALLSTGLLGTTTNADVSLIRQSTERMRLTATGVTVGGLPGTAQDPLDVRGGVRVQDGSGLFARLYVGIGRTEFQSRADQANFYGGNNINVIVSGGGAGFYRLNANSEAVGSNIITATTDRFVGIRTVSPTAVFQVAGGQVSQLQAGAFGNFANGNDWIGIGVAGTQAVPITSVYGLGMSRAGSAAYFNLVNNALNPATKDLIIGYGGEGAVLNDFQRMRIRSIRTNGVNAPVNKDLMVFNANGFVGVNADPTNIAFFVDATSAAISTALPSVFRTMTILTNGNFSTPANVAAATFASVGLEGNSALNTTDVIGLRAQNGNAGVNCQVNGNAAEITWQDLQYSNDVAFATNTQDRLTFNFRNNVNVNNTTNKREVMTILANGRVGINTAAPVNSGTANVLPVTGAMDFYLDVFGGARAQGFWAFSDQRFKTNVKTIENPMARVMKMRGTSYLFTGPGSTEGIQQIGFIAQELEQVVPEAVVLGDDGIYAVNYGALTPILVEGMKEQQQQIEAQQAEIAALRAEVAAMKGTSTNNRDGVQTPLEVNPSLGVLQQNVPNPFNQQTVINFTVAENAGIATMAIYDLNGRQIRAEQLNQRGKGQYVINANELAPGMYIYTLIVDGKPADSKRMIVTE